MSPRFLFLLGQMCRYGADIVERTSPVNGGQRLTMERCLAIDLAFFRCAQGAPPPGLHQHRQLRTTGNVQRVRAVESGPICWHVSNSLWATMVALVRARKGTCTRPPYLLRVYFNS